MPTGELNSPDIFSASARSVHSPSPHHSLADAPMTAAPDDQRGWPNPFVTHFGRNSSRA